MEESFFYWLAEVKRSSPKTIRTYKTYLQFLFATGGDILKFTEYRQIENLILDLRSSRGWEDNTVRNCASAAVEYYAWATISGRIEKNPMPRHYFPKNNKKQIRWLDWQDERVIKLLKHPKNTVRTMAILHVLRSSGVRAGELCNLRRVDVNGRVLRVNGKTGEGDAIIDNEALFWLNKYLDGLPLVYSGEWLFTDEKYQRKYTEHALWRHVTTLGRLVGLEKCNPHMFRHGFAGDFIRKGGRIEVAAKLLRHKSTSMTHHYLNFSTPQKLELYDEILQKAQ